MDFGNNGDFLRSRISEIGKGHGFGIEIMSRLSLLEILCSRANEHPMKAFGHLSALRSGRP